MSDILIDVATNFYVNVHDINPHCGLKIQAKMLAFMDRTGLRARKASNGNNGAPYQVPKSTLQRWWKHYEQWGEAPIQTSKRPFLRQGRDRLGNGIGDRIVQIVERDPSLYLDEIQAIIFSETGCRYHISTIWRYLNSPAVNFSLQVLTEKAVQKSRYEQQMYRGCLSELSKDKDPSVFCFVDESAVGKNASRRRRGWARRGSPAAKFAIFESDISNKKRYTLIGCVDINGFVLPACDVVFHRTTKTNTATGTVDSDRFVAYVEQMLVPCLGNYEQGEPRSVVIMDNALIHKDPRVRALIEATGTYLFRILVVCFLLLQKLIFFLLSIFTLSLSVLVTLIGALLIWNAAYSPELNPIEACFHQYKSVLRRNKEHFKRDILGVHLFALQSSVNRANMINYYKATAMQGCIHNLPTVTKSKRKRIRSINNLVLLLVVYKRSRTE